MRTKSFLLVAMLLLFGTANVSADKYYQTGGNHNFPTRHATLEPGMQFFIYNTAHRPSALLNTKLDYSPKNVSGDKTGDYASTRNINNVQLNGSTLGDCTLSLTDAEKKLVYVDKTSTIFSVKAGETLTPVINHNRDWINAAAFIDYDADGFSLSKAVEKIQASTTLPTEGMPEYIYHMKNGEGYVNGSTQKNDGTNKYDYAQFALYAVEGVADAYYIYNLSSRKWLSYNKAGSYGYSASFIKLSAEKVEGAYFAFNNVSDNNYTIHPYNTSNGIATRAICGYDDNNIGLWLPGNNTNQGYWQFEHIDYGDVVAFSFYSFNDNSDAEGYNSAWTSISGTNRKYSTMPSFVAPTKPGKYRMRFLLDYNSLNPDGNNRDQTVGGGNTMSNGGAMVDVTLEVVGETDYTGFFYNTTTQLGVTKAKGRDKYIYNECHIFTLESALDNNGDTIPDAYYIKSLSSGTYVGIDGSTSNSIPQRLYIYSWPQAVTLDTDTYVSDGNGAVATNGAIKQAIDLNSEAANYSIVQNSQLITQGTAEEKKQNPYNVFVITNEAKDTYWNSGYNTFATGETGSPYAFITVDQVDQNDYEDIVDLHIYSRCDLYSAQKIYGYVQSDTMIYRNYGVETDGTVPCGTSRLLDGDYNTYSMTNIEKNTTGAYHSFTVDLGQAVSSAYIYMARRADAQYAPKSVKISVSNELDGTYKLVPDDYVNNGILLGCVETGLATKNEFFTPTAINFNGDYQFVRIEAMSTTNDDKMCMALSELYVLPNEPVINQALTYQQLPVYNTRANYTAGIDALNTTHPDVKLLSGVPLPGNKYRIYADAYDAKTGQFVNYDLCATVNITDGVTTYGLSATGNYTAATTEAKKYYEWICEALPNGRLVFRNPATGQYIVNGSLQPSDATGWAYNTNETYRHGVPLINTAGQYLAVGTAASDGSIYWQGDVKQAQNQTTFYTYTQTTSKTIQVEVTNDKGTPDDTSDDVIEIVDSVVTTTTTVVDEAHYICTDFVFLPVANAEGEKKITIIAEPLAIRNSEFYYKGVKYTLPFSRILEPAVDFEYDFESVILNANSRYAMPSTNMTQNVAEAGNFVFCAHGSVVNAYYIYSVGEQKWFTYDNTVAASREGFITLSAEKDENDYFILEDVTNSDYKGYKQIRPNLTGTFYLNWYKGTTGVTLGIFTTNGSNDAGSRFKISPEMSIKATCGTLHEFLGFYKKNTSGEYVALNEEEVITTLNYSDVADGDYFEARFRIKPQPFVGSTERVTDAEGNTTQEADIHFYKLKNIATDKYASFTADNESMSLVDEATALSLFYFTNTSFDEESHASAFIETAVSLNKLYNVGYVDDEGTTTAATWNSGGQVYFIQPNYVASAAEGKREGYAITRTKLNENNNPEGLFANSSSQLIGGSNVEKANSLWTLEAVNDDEAKTMLKTYVTSKAAEVKTILDTQSADYDESNADVPDTTYPVYDEEKIAGHHTYVDGIVANCETATAIYDLKSYAQQLYWIKNNVAATTLQMPAQTAEWGTDLSKYNPKWYYIRNVEASWGDDTKSYAAKYVADDVNMSLSDIKAEGGKSLSNLFYIGGNTKYENAINEHLDSCCIHNFAAHYHSMGNVIDKTLVSENEVLFENITLTGAGKEVTNIPGVKKLENSAGWRIVVEGTSNGNSYNNFGSCILAAGDNAFLNNYTNGFQVYMKADGYIVVKLSGYDDFAFDHIRGAYDTFKVEIMWTPNETGVDAETLQGKVYIAVTNSLGVTLNKTVTKWMKDIEILSSGMPVGMSITNLGAEKVNAMQWNEEHDSSNWFVLPSSNQNYPGHSIVTNGPVETNFGWHNADSKETKIESYVGNHDYSTWEFVKVVDFLPHMQELLNLWNIDECTVYHAPLVEMYEKLKAVYDQAKAKPEEFNNEASFNSMIVTIRQYNSLPKEEFYAPKADKLYTIRPAYDKEYGNAFAVDTCNNMVNASGMYVLAKQDTPSTPVVDKVYYMYAQPTAGDTWYLYANNYGFLNVAADAPTNDDAAYHWSYIDAGAGTFQLLNGNGQYLATDATSGTLKLDHTPSTYKFVDGSLWDVTTRKHMVTDGKDFTATDAAQNYPGSSYFYFVELDLEYDSKVVWTFGNIARTETSEIDNVTCNFLNLHTQSYIKGITTGVGNATALNEESASTVTVKPIGSSVVSIAVGDTYLTRQGTVGYVYGGNEVVLEAAGIRDVFSSVTSWYIEEVADYEKVRHVTTVKNKFGLGSLMLGFTSKVPAGIEAFYPRWSGDVLDSRYVSMKSYGEPEDAERLVPANTPVMLRAIGGYDNSSNANYGKYDESTTYKFYYSTTDSVTDPDDKANGTDDGIVIGGALYNKVIPASLHDGEMTDGNCNIYMFVSGKNYPRLYWIYENYKEDGTNTGNNDNGGHFKCNANRAYIALSRAAVKNMSWFSFRFDNLPTTDITDIEDDIRVVDTPSSVKGIYDLQGRKLNEITEPGIYIVDGVKVVVK